MKDCTRLRKIIAAGGPVALRTDEAAQDHIAECPECFAFLEAMAELEQAFSAMPVADAPDAVVEALLEQVTAEPLPAVQPPPLPGRHRFQDAVTASLGRVRDWLAVGRHRWQLAGAAATAILVISSASVLLQRSRGELAYSIDGVDVTAPASEPELQKDWAQERDAAGAEGIETEEESAKAAPGFFGAVAPTPAPEDLPTGRDFGAVVKLDAGVTLPDSKERESAKNEITVTAEAPVIDVSSAHEDHNRSQVGGITGITSEFADESGDGLEARQRLQNVPIADAAPEKPEPVRRNEETAGERKDLDEIDSATLEKLRGLGYIADEEDRRSESESWSGDGLSSPDLGPAPARSTEVAQAFLDAREEVDGLQFIDPTGYWRNTYVPGDRDLRALQARLLGWDRSVLSGLVSHPVRLHEAARQPSQPFDPPQDAALAVYVNADRRGITARERLLVQVGLRGSERSSGRRPAMNIGLVLDLRGQVPAETAAGMRALVEALAAQKDLGDRFSLTVAGRAGGTVVPAGAFRYGPLMVAMQELFEGGNEVGQGLSLVEAVQEAISVVSAGDDPSAPLGSSAVLVATAGSLAAELGALERAAHRSAVDGVPVSVIGVGSGVDVGELERVVLAGQGNRRLMQGAADAAGVVERELTAVSRVVARAVRLRIRLAPGVQLVEVVGSNRLDDRRAEQVREAERAIDTRLARNLGIEADRGEDEEGIQIVIPSFHAGDAHSVLLDVVAPGPGPVADVTVRYKDLVLLRNGVARDHLDLGRAEAAPGPLELAVLKGLLAQELSVTLQRAGDEAGHGQVDQAAATLEGARDLLVQLPLLRPGLRNDPDLAADVAMLEEYLALLRSGSLEPGSCNRLADSLRYAGRLKVLPAPMVDLPAKGGTR